MEVLFKDLLQQQQTKTRKRDHSEMEGEKVPEHKKRRCELEERSSKEDGVRGAPQDTKMVSSVLPGRQMQIELLSSLLAKVC